MISRAHGLASCSTLLEPLLIEASHQIFCGLAGGRWLRRSYELANGYKARPNP